MRSKIGILLILFLCSLCIIGCETTNTPINEQSINNSETQNDVSDDGENTSVHDEQSSNNSEASKDNSNGDETASNPDEIIGEPIEGQFGEYSFVYEENGKSIITIFTEEQIADIKSKRENGELFELSVDDIKFIINDTFEIFENYDIIKVRDISGNLNTYRGLSFIHSEEYFDSFGSVISTDIDASFDYKQDLINAIFKRIEVLHTEIYDGFDDESKWVFIGTKPISNDKYITLCNSLANVYEIGMGSDKDRQVLSAYKIPAFYFDIKNEQIGYIANLSSANKSAISQLYTADMLPEQVANQKYDYNGKVVVAEIYETKTKELLARVRIDEENNPDEISEIENLVNQFINSTDGSDNAQQHTEYRVAVYFNGFTFYDGKPDFSLYYAPDGDIDLISFSNGKNIFIDDYFFIKNASPLTEYINALIKSQLEN